MKPRYFPIFGSLFAFTAAGTLLLPPAAPAQEAGPVEANEDVEVLTRGPVHEAFAESVSFEAEAGFTVSSAPPELIEELPPDQQPDGENVTWIPGYWAWDDDQSDFLWISGVWRNIPPGRQWVPGYWNDLGGGSFQWISGYWADTTTEEVEYVETAPPKSIDAGPNIAAPSEDHTWVPGNWMWSSSRYVWRPGYWLALRPNWTWVPSRYCWTPRGYTYVDGYWDYAVINRGVLFAPVHFRRHVWSTPGYYYTPSLVVSLNVFSDHLFIRPRCRHYYFGDYYAPRYRDSGFYATFHWHRHHHRGYDPIYAYQRWDHRHDSHWERHREDNYNFFRDNDRYRPPHTWAVMQGLRNEKFDDDRNRSRLFANSFDGFVKSPERGLKFRPVDKDRREKIVAERQEMRAFTRQRRDLEAKPVALADRGGEDKKGVFREKLRRSPVVGRQAEQFADNDAPPKRPEPRGNRARLKDDAATADVTPERGKGKGMAKRETEGDSTKPDRGPAGRGQGKADSTDEPKGTPKDRVRPTPGRNTDAKPEREKTMPERQVQPKPQREKATPERQVQPKPQREKATPERQVQPKPQREKVTPERQVQPKPQREKVTPERQVQPKPQREKAAPERQVQPKRQVQPERQVQPKREVQPQRQPQVKPERKQKDKEEARQVPQRRPEASVQRIAQPKPQRQQQARPQPQQRQVQPQRQAQPRQQQVRPQPQQRQVQPQRQQSQPRQPQNRPQQRQNQKERDEKKDRA
jgi:hypothetical protein